MVDMYAYCPDCNREDGKETPVKKIVLVNGVMVFHLECGHTIMEKFRI